MFVACGIVAFAILSGVLAWPVARLAANPAKVWTFAIMVGAAIGLVVATHRQAAGGTFIAEIDGAIVCGKFYKWRRFRSPEGAMRAAVKEIMPST